MCRSRTVRPSLPCVTGIKVKISGSVPAKRWCVVYSKHVQGEGDLSAGEGLSVAGVCRSAQRGPYDESDDSSLIYSPDGPQYPRCVVTGPHCTDHPHFSSDTLLVWH